MITFTLNDEQVKKYQKWRDKLPSAPTGAIGGRIVFEFCYTSIGTVERVRDDVTGKTLDLTEYENW